MIEAVQIQHHTSMRWKVHAVPIEVLAHDEVHRSWRKKAHACASGSSPRAERSKTDSRKDGKLAKGKLKNKAAAEI
jgi:hypothetical protein